MSSFTIKENLLKYKNAGTANFTGKTGVTKRCVVIPIDDNPNIFVGEKGIYASLTVVERKETGKYGDTHFVKMSVPSDVYSKMTDEEKDAIPIIGSMKPMERKASSQAMPATATVSAANMEEDDPPF